MPSGSILALFASLLLADLCHAQAARNFTITRFAGGAPHTEAPAASAALLGPHAVAVDADRNVFFASREGWIFKVDPAGFLTRVTGKPAARNADAAGNRYYADAAAHVIRKRAPDGTVSIVAGNGVPGYAGDRGPATEALLNAPESVAVDPDGNLYIADSGNHRIRKVTPANIMTTIAGNGTTPDSGDGGSALQARLFRPQGLAVDTAGNVYIAEPANNRIRKVAPDGTITTLRIGAAVSSPQRLATDAYHNLYISDTANHRVLKLGMDGVVSRLASDLENPGALALDADGNVYIAEARNRVRKVTPDGVMTTVEAGSFERIHGLAVDARGKLHVAGEARDVAADANGNIYIADAVNGRLLQVDPNGVVRAIAGPADGIGISAGVAVDMRGNVYLSDELNHVVWMLELERPSATTVTPFALTYAISGRVVMPALISGAIVLVSGSASTFVTTDGLGNFSVTGLPAGGNYTLTPVKAGWVYNPPSVTFNNLSSDQNAGFFLGGQVVPNNLALGKVATQSSDVGGANGSAASAVDGNSDGNFFAGSVTQTALTANPWWQVDLGGSYSVSSVKIWNRTDCCMDRLSDYWVFVSDTPFAPNDTPASLQSRAGTWSSHQTAYPNPFTTIAPNAQGRYLRVQLSGTNDLSLAEVEVTGTSVGIANLALGKAAAQSSTLAGYGGAGASNAVDGNTNGNFSAGSVTHTAGQANAWWEVDLGGPALVYNVIIWNRTDCCANRLSDFWVYVSNTPFSPSDTPVTLQNRPFTSAIHVTSAPTPSLNIPIGGVVQNRYVRIQLSGTDYLSLAEVQVLAAPVSAPVSLAIGKPAIQSSTLSGFGPAGASNAVDGNTNGSFPAGSVTHTVGQLNPWWQVDLGSTVAITSLSIWNRTDCCPDRLNDFWVFVSDTPFGVNDTPTTLAFRAGTANYHQSSYPNPSVTLPWNALGRFVRIQLAGFNYLSLAEVQVFGTVVTGPPNLARGKTATQSSTFAAYPSAVASSAIDGKTDGTFGAGSVTHTYGEANAWWQVDLGSSAAIGSIRIWNRTDCCSDRLSDYWVFVSDLPFAANDTPATLQGRAGTWSSHQTSFPNPSATSTVNAVGRYIRVQLTGTNYLSLAEVEVF